MMRPLFSFAVATALALLGSSAALAHRGGQHVMGTVKSVDDKSLTVTSKGTEVTIQLDDSTKFEKGGAAASSKDLSPGDRVVVHAKRVDAGLKADVVKIGLSRARQREQPAKSPQR